MLLDTKQHLGQDQAEAQFLMNVGMSLGYILQVRVMIKELVFPGQADWVLVAKC